MIAEVFEILEHSIIIFIKDDDDSNVMYIL